MMRLNPEGYKRFIGSNKFEVSYGGGEANVAVSLANFGVDTAFVTKLPENDLGTCALQAVRQYGVDTSFIKRGGERLGVYLLEKRGKPKTLKSYFMIELDLLLLKAQSKILIGMQFLKGQLGSILPVLLPL